MISQSIRKTEHNYQNILGSKYGNIKYDINCARVLIKMLHLSFKLIFLYGKYHQNSLSKYSCLKKKNHKNSFLLSENNPYVNCMGPKILRL